MDQPHISGKAVLITGGLLDDGHAKTAHGLIRTGKRFEILGVIDEKFAGRDAGEFVDGEPIGVPVKASIDDFLQDEVKPEFAIIGMATKGGILPKELYASVKRVLAAGVNLVNGLHQPIGEIEEIKGSLDGSGAKIYDIRKSKPFAELHFWEGKVQDITAIKIAVLGLDCATGKRTTSRFLEEALNKSGYKAEMIYTGQTGWMQGADYGLLFDATANDFIPGEIENALWSCWKNNNPEVLIMEGQSGLRNPSGPCGSEFIIAGDADGVVLQHPATRKKFSGAEHYYADIPDVLDEVELIERMGSKVVGITINTEGMTKDDVESYRAELTARTDIPVVFPLYESLDSIVESVMSLKK